MSEPIVPGDLVMVVKVSPCGCSQSLGTIFRVKSIIPFWPAGWSCIGCNERHPLDGPQAEDEADGTVAAVWRLKRIPPLAELQTERHTEEIEA